MTDSPTSDTPIPSEEQIADIRLASSKLSGSGRRSFQAEMTMKYCGGSARRAARMFGWDRRTVACGLGERRTGIVCLGAQSAYGGRPRWEARYPQAAMRLREIAEAHAQQDPTFRTSLAFTRLTAKAARQALRAEGMAEQQLPSPSTMAEVLNRMGYRLRKVLKAKPQKKLKETDAIFENVQKKTIRAAKLAACAA